VLCASIIRQSYLNLIIACFAFTIIIWHIEQVELGRKYDDLELLKNDTHPQFNLIKARN
jgi:hypothetical protein